MHIHILGICGTFMGGVAALAKAAGHKCVCGKDFPRWKPEGDAATARDDIPKALEADGVVGSGTADVSDSGKSELCDGLRELAGAIPDIASKRIIEERLEQATKAESDTTDKPANSNQPMTAKEAHATCNPLMQ